MPIGVMTRRCAGRVCADELLDQIAIDGELIVDVGEPGTLGDGRREIDADGMIVTPGWVDVHTHYDAQAFWDGTLSPSPYHGVTSVVGGNCGFSIAPLSEEAGPYLMKRRDGALGALVGPLRACSGALLPQL